MKCPILKAAKIITFSGKCPSIESSSIDNCMQTECEWWEVIEPDTKIGNCAILGILFKGD